MPPSPTVDLINFTWCNVIQQIKEGSQFSNLNRFEKKPDHDFCKIVLLYLTVKFLQGFINNKDHFTHETSQTTKCIYVTVRDVDFF